MGQGQGCLHAALQQCGCLSSGTGSRSSACSPSTRWVNEKWDKVKVVCTQPFNKVGERELGQGQGRLHTALQQGGCLRSGIGSRLSSYSPSLQQDGCLSSGTGSRLSSYSPSLQQDGCLSSGTGSRSSACSPSLQQDGCLSSGTGSRLSSCSPSTRWVNEKWDRVKVVCTQPFNKVSEREVGQGQGRLHAALQQDG